MRMRTLAGGLAAVLLPSAGALAAPQILGLVASERVVPFTCEGTSCTAELTAFCLEEQRQAPLAGRLYRAVDPKRLTLVVTGPDGHKRSVPAEGLLRIVATRRGIAAVRVEIDRRVLARFGAAKIAIRVAPGASLVPRPQAGDKAPHSKREIARIVGPMRAIGTRIVDRAGPGIEAARLVNQAINRLPRRGRANPAQRRNAWSASIAARTPHVGRAQASTIYRTCARWTANPHTPFSLRRCLEEDHKLLMSRLNKRYWDASRLGM